MSEPTNEEPQNREQRRAAEHGRDAQAEQSRQKLTDAATPPDVTSARAKSSRHGKSTADKWNQ